MPAQPYPVNPVPAVPMTPVRAGPRAPRTGQQEAADTAGQGDPRVRSGPVSAAAPDLLMGTLGWGLRTPRFTVPSAPNVRHGRPPLADPRQWHYNDPGTIPGPGGIWLTAPLQPAMASPVPDDARQERSPLPLASGPPPLKPWASSMPLPTGPG